MGKRKNCKVCWQVCFPGSSGMCADCFTESLRLRNSDDDSTVPKEPQVHKERTPETRTISTVPPVLKCGRSPVPLKDMLATFTRPMRGHPTRLILDGFCADFFILFDVEEDPETPSTIGTVNIAVCRLLADDFLADSLCLVMNADKFGVMRFLAAIGIQRFDEKTKAWFYSLGSVLRTDEA